MTTRPPYGSHEGVYPAVVVEQTGSNRLRVAAYATPDTDAEPTHTWTVAETVEVGDRTLYAAGASPRFQVALRDESGADPIRVEVDSDRRWVRVAWRSLDA